MLSNNSVGNPIDGLGYIFQGILSDLKINVSLGTTWLRGQPYPTALQYL